MSFSREVKEELAGHISPARHCQIAELSALLACAGSLAGIRMDIISVFRQKMKPF